MPDKSPHLVALERMLEDLENDLRSNPDPRLAIRERLVAVIAHVERLSANDGDHENRSIPGAPTPPAHHAPSSLISPEVTGKPRPRTYRFRDVMVSYLHEHGSTHKAKLAKVCVERNVFASEADALGAQTRLFRIWRDVFSSDGNGFFNLRPDAPSDTMPRWSSKRQAVRR
jgi:hypothetical protein